MTHRSVNVGRRARAAYAYIDGGTASMIFQLAIGGIVAAVFMMKSFWSRIKSVVSSLARRHKHLDT